MMEALSQRPTEEKVNTTPHFSPLLIEKYKIAAHSLLSFTLNQRQLCDLELLLNGGLAPLTGFMGQADYNCVLDEMRLSDGTLWPMPIMLDIDRKFAASLKPGDEVALRDAEGLLLAILQVSEMWEVDRDREAMSVFNTTDRRHPGVNYLYQYTRDIYVGGNLIGISLPHHYDFKHLRHTPAMLKQQFRQMGWNKIVAFQTRNPMHRAHQELTLRAMQQTGANLLIHPAVGMTKPGDIEYYTRVRCYEHIMKTYEPGTAFLSLLPIAMRMGGPRGAIWHAIIRRNYGCTHFIVGRDHAGPGKNSAGENFYGPYEAQELTLKHQTELGIEIIPFQEMAYSHKQQLYFPIDQFPKNEEPASISGTELRERLQKNLHIPDWFSYPAVIKELRNAYPERHQQGFTIFFTGLPSSGKTTLANAIAIKLRELTNRPITMLDGDIIRLHLSQGLGFSQEDRESNITRVGFVATEITRHRGIAICALVSPFEKTRNMIRQMVSEVGGYIEVYVSTSLEVCEKRDRKGLYKKARAGLVKQFTGVSDPYEAPSAPEIKVDTSDAEPEVLVDNMIKQIRLLGYIQ